MRTTKRSHHRRLLTVVSTSTLLSALVLPFGVQPAVAGFAPETVKKWGCELTALRPYENNFPNDVIQHATHWVKIKCNRDQRVRIVMQAMENDGSSNSILGDDKIGRGYNKKHSVAAGRTHYFSYREIVPDWDDDNRADIFTLSGFSVINDKEELKSGLAQAPERVIPIRDIRR